MTSRYISAIVRDWLSSVRADPAATGQKNPDRVLRIALEAALINYSRKKGDCFDVELGEFLDDEGDYYVVADKPTSTKHRKEIGQWEAILRLSRGDVRRITKGSYEWVALRLALYPEERAEGGDAQDS